MVFNYGFEKPFASSLTYLRQREYRIFFWEWPVISSKICRLDWIKFPQKVSPNSGMPSCKCILVQQQVNFLGQVLSSAGTASSYFTKTLSKAERIYCVTKKRVVCCREGSGRKLLIRTDHATFRISIVWVWNQTLGRTEIHWLEKNC